MAYQFDSRVRYSETNEKRVLSLVSLIDYFQDCSTFQSEECGHGLDFFKRKNLAWMVLSWQVEIIRMPMLGEKITVQTWPYNFKAFYGYRNYALLSETGEYLAKANSVWALIDVESGHPHRVAQEHISGYEISPQLDMKEYSRKINMPEENEIMESLVVTKNQLDTNHHVNNGQYIQMAEAFLPGEFVPNLLRVEYRQQARLHDVIIPMVNKAENAITVSLCDAAEKPYAIVRFERVEDFTVTGTGTK